MDVRAGHDRMYLLDLAHGRVKWRVRVSTMKQRVP
jgi:hypothetical protein